MIPLRIRIENFMSHRYTDIDFSNINSVLIVGKRKNDERHSNGVGKTTIFHAVDFALFAVYPTSTIDKIVRDGSEFCKVMFDFAIDNKIYRVIRERNIRTSKSSLTLLKYIKDDWENIDTRTQAHLETELASLLKINYKTFKQSVLFSQMDLSGLSEAKSSDARRKILKSILSLEIYGKLEELAKQKLKKVRGRLETAQTAIANLEDPDKDIKIYSKKLKDIDEETKENLNNIEIERKNIDKYKQEILALELKSSSEVEEEIKQLSLRKTEIENKISKINIDIQESENNISALTKDARLGIERLSKLADKLESIQSSNFREISSIIEELNNTREEESNQLAHIKSLNRKADDLRTPMPDGDNCPHCRQPLTLEHREECLKKAAAELDQIDNLIFNDKKVLKELSDHRQKLENELAEVRSAKSNEESLLKEIDIKKEGITKEKTYINNLKDRLQRLNKDKVSYIENLNSTESRLEKILSKYDSYNIKDTKKKIKEYNSLINIISSKIEKYSNRVNELNTEKGKFSEKINYRKNDKKNLKEYTKNVKELMEEYKVRQMNVKGFSTSGIPTMIIYTILDDLQIEANNRLARLRPELELQFRIIKDKDDGNQEDVLDIFYKIHGQDREYKQLSGGQKLIIALSLKLALATVIQKRLGVDIKFLELDEVDQSLDKAGIDAFIETIKELQNEYKIFIITHNDYLKDKFENAILVENDGKNGSTAKLVTSW